MTKLLNLFVIAILFSLAIISCQDKHSKLKDGLYAEINTVKGTILVQLEFEKTPITVANFMTLAEGKNTFVAADLKDKPLYNGLKFHRVLADFMIQGGDPDGNGAGGTGYQFKDEITDLKFDNGGLLAMANSGPGTNSSQFFITHLATPWLDGKHTIFGHVVENGMTTVNKIVQDDIIKSIIIIRRGDAAKKFDAIKVFNNYFASEAQNLKAQASEKEALAKEYEAKYKAVIDKKAVEIVSLKKSGKKTKSGLIYRILKKGNGTKLADGSQIEIDYSGFFDNGVLFQSSIEAVEKEFGKVDETKKSQNGYQPIPFQAGQKQGMIPGFLEALALMNKGDKLFVFIPSNLAYGPAGGGNGAIPPNANLIFELEILNK